MSAEHNHEPHCCCQLPTSDLIGCPDCGYPSLYRQTCTNCGWRAYADPIRCPSCPEHGDLATPYTEQETTNG